MIVAPTKFGKLLGHSDIETTARYAHLARDSLHEAAERIAGSIAADILQCVEQVDCTACLTVGSIAPCRSARGFDADLSVKVLLPFDLEGSSTDADQQTRPWARHGKPEIFNTDHGSQLTSFAFTGRLQAAGIRISMDGRGRCLENIFIERL